MKIKIMIGSEFFSIKDDDIIKEKVKDIYFIEGGKVVLQLDENKIIVPYENYEYFNNKKSNFLEDKVFFKEDEKSLEVDYSFIRMNGYFTCIESANYYLIHHKYCDKKYFWKAD